jgi:hypothetical protein
VPKILRVRSELNLVPVYRNNVAAIWPSPLQVITKG